MVVMEPKNKVCRSDVREGILFKTIGIYTNFGDTDSWWYYHLSVSINQAICCSIDEKLLTAAIRLRWQQGQTAQSRFRGHPTPGIPFWNQWTKLQMENKSINGGVHQKLYEIGNAAVHEERRDICYAACIFQDMI
jgi:hypothetical protein